MAYGYGERGGAVGDLITEIEQGWVGYDDVFIVELGVGVPVLLLRIRAVYRVLQKKSLRSKESQSFQTQGRSPAAALTVGLSLDRQQVMLPRLRWHNRAQRFAPSPWERIFSILRSIQ